MTQAPQARNVFAGLLNNLDSLTIPDPPPAVEPHPEPEPADPDAPVRFSMGVASENGAFIIKAGVFEGDRKRFRSMYDGALLAARRSADEIRTAAGAEREALASKFTAAAGRLAEHERTVKDAEAKLQGEADRLTAADLAGEDTAGAWADLQQQRQDIARHLSHMADRRKALEDAHRDQLAKLDAATADKVRERLTALNAAAQEKVAEAVRRVENIVGPVVLAWALASAELTGTTTSPGKLAAMTAGPAAPSDYWELPLVRRAPAGAVEPQPSPGPQPR